MPQTMLPANETEIEVMSQGISSYLVLFIMGIVCTFLNIPLLYVLLKSSRFRSDSKLLICLAIGDMINCLALCYLGYNRHRLYMESIKTYMVPMETSRTCAKKAYMWLRLIGNVWPPTVQLLMGAERTLACWAPVFHLTYIRKRSLHACIFSVFVVLLFCLVGIVFIFTRQENVVKFDCGRRATFSNIYAQTIYCYEIFGYFIGLILNAAAYFHCLSLLRKTCVCEQMKRVRYYFAIAAISTLLVAVPNFKQLFIFRLKEAGLQEWISQLIYCLSLVAASLNIFIYLIFNRDFRNEFCSAFLPKRTAEIKVIFIQITAPVTPISIALRRRSFRL